MKPPHLTAPLLLIGCVGFPINWYAFHATQIPLAELALFFVAIVVFWRSRPSPDFLTAPGALALIGLIVWIFLADLIHHTPAASLARELTRNIILIAPVLLFSLTPTQSALPALSLGLLFGLVLFSNVQFLTALMATHDISFKLKWILPTPAVFLCLSPHYPTPEAALTG